MPDQNQQTPVPVNNPLAQDVVTDVEAILDAGKEAAEKAAIAQVPFLGAPIIRQLFGAFCNWFAGLIETPLAVYSGRVVIDIEEYQRLKAAVAAQDALTAAKKTGDPHAIATASAEVDQAVAAAVHYVGATRP